MHKTRRTIIILIVFAALFFLTYSFLSLTGLYNTTEYNYTNTRIYNSYIRQQHSRDTVVDKGRYYEQVQRICKRLFNAYNQTSGVIRYNWQINLIADRQVNAFAVPGGNIVIYAGLILELELTDDELAAVIGHEMGHVIYNHSQNQEIQSVLNNTTKNAAEIFLSAAVGFDPTQAAKLSNFLGNELVAQAYSRAHEYNADVFGLFLMAKAGYNPNAAITMQEKLGRDARRSNKLNALLRSHPFADERIANLKDYLPKAMQLYRRYQNTW